MASPRPRPPYARVVLLSACRKRSNRWGKNSLLMPFPVSRTTSWADVPMHASFTSIRPPLGVNFTALVSRFQTTCWMRPVGHDGPDVGGERSGDHDVLGVGRRADGLEPGVDDAGEVDGGGLERHRAGDDAADVEEIRDELVLAVRVPLDDLERSLRRGRVERPGPQHLDPAENRAERGPELVGKRGQE